MYDLKPLAAQLAGVRNFELANALRAHASQAAAGAPGAPAASPAVGAAPAEAPAPGLPAAPQQGDSGAGAAAPAGPASRLAGAHWELAAEAWSVHLVRAALVRAMAEAPRLMHVYCGVELPVQVGAQQGRGRGVEGAWDC